MTSGTTGRSLVRLLPDILAVAGTSVVFIVAAVADIDNAVLVQATCGALTLFATTLLIVRATTFPKMDSTLTKLADDVGEDGAIRKGIVKQSADLDRLMTFLTEGGLDGRLLEAATTANGYLHNFERVGIVGAYPTLGEVNLGEEMRSAKESVRIISTWTGCLIQLSEPLLEQARNGCDVRILILRHDSPFAAIRGLELDPYDKDCASRQIATEICEFNRLFHDNKDVKTRLRVKAFDARPPMCMFAHDDIRLIGSLWPGINAMDGPVVRAVGDGDRFLSTSLGLIADREFERLWDDDKTRYIKVINGVPHYTESREEAWWTDENFASVLEEVRRAKSADGEQGRRRAIDRIRSDPEKILVAVLELHQNLRSKRHAEAALIVGILEEIDELLQAESVLQEAVSSGDLQFLDKLVRLQLRHGKRRAAERNLRRAVSTGNDHAISHLTGLLESSGRKDQVEQVLRDGVEAGSPYALITLVELLDRSHRSAEAHRLLKRLASEGDPVAASLLAIRRRPGADGSR
jgi:hypothetical protein